MQHVLKTQNAKLKTQNVKLLTAADWDRLVDEADQLISDLQDLSWDLTHDFLGDPRPWFRELIDRAVARRRRRQLAAASAARRETACYRAIAGQLELMLDQQTCALRTALTSRDRRGVRRAGQRVRQLRTALAQWAVGVIVEALPRGAWAARPTLGSDHIACRVVERDGLAQWFCACRSGCRCWSAAILEATEMLDETLSLLDSAGEVWP